MSISLHSVINSDKPEKEFVWLIVKEKTKLGGYAIVDRTFDENEKVSNEFRHIFIFPNIEVEKGDLVRLWTGEGTYKKNRREKEPGNIHELYWQSGKCVWNDKSRDTATLIKFSVEGKVKVSTLKK